MVLIREVAGVAKRRRGRPPECSGAGAGGVAALGWIFSDVLPAALMAASACYGAVFDDDQGSWNNFGHFAGLDATFCRRPVLQIWSVTAVYNGFGQHWIAGSTNKFVSFLSKAEWPGLKCYLDQVSVQNLCFASVTRHFLKKNEKILKETVLTIFWEIGHICFEDLDGHFSWKFCPSFWFEFHSSGKLDFSRFFNYFPKNLELSWQYYAILRQLPHKWTKISSSLNWRHQVCFSDSLQFLNLHWYKIWLTWNKVLLLLLPLSGWVILLAFVLGVLVM